MQKYGYCCYYCPFQISADTFFETIQNRNWHAGNDRLLSKNDHTLCTFETFFPIKYYNTKKVDHYQILYIRPKKNHQLKIFKRKNVINFIQIVPNAVFAIAFP